MRGKVEEEPVRLLLVEDDNHVAAALTAVLSRHGFDITHARSGEEALKALLPGAGAPFGVVLLDLGLPDQDGFEVCGRIRKLTATPVIMVTARSDVRSRIHGLNLGADDYVVKPYDSMELLARIHAVSRRTLPSESGAGAATELPGPAGANTLIRGHEIVDTGFRTVYDDGRALLLNVFWPAGRTTMIFQ